jgi:phosphoglycolate phosphatase
VQTIVIADVDGTLVDSNYQNVLAWYRAFRGCGVTVPMWRVHRAVGMGGDQLVAAVAGDDVEREHGDDVRAAWAEIFGPMLDEVAPLEGARDLLVAVKEQGHQLVLASSGRPDHVEHYLDLLRARDIADAWTSSQDVEQTKPAPDLLAVAMEKVTGQCAVALGDSVWDCQAARKLELPSVGLRTGGFGVEELAAAGASKVYDDLPALCAELDRLPFAVPTK